MVYNALKLFMEINPELFDAAMQQYKQRKLEYVPSFIASLSSLDLMGRPYQRTSTRSRAV